MQSPVDGLKVLHYGFTLRQTFKESVHWREPQVVKGMQSP